MFCAAKVVCSQTTGNFLARMFANDGYQTLFTDQSREDERIIEEACLLNTNCDS
jgi:hypothetical protein